MGSNGRIGCGRFTDGFRRRVVVCGQNVACGQNGKQKIKAKGEGLNLWEGSLENRLTPYRIESQRSKTIVNILPKALGEIGQDVVMESGSRL